MDYFIKKNDYQNSALVAHEIMLQENSENELTLTASLLSCLKCLKIGIADISEESKKEDSKQSTVWLI